jgi:hypothetical protein
MAHQTGSHIDLGTIKTLERDLRKSVGLGPRTDFDGKPFVRAGQRKTDQGRP